MLYHLFEYLDQAGYSGAGVFQYISFRAALSGITALLFSILVGKKFIAFLQKKQIGETIRNLGLEGQMQKKGTPTMGGLIIISAIVLPALLFTDLTNVYVMLMLISCLWMGLFGFIDDYIKVFKKDKEGMKARTKLLGQLGLGIFIAIAVDYTHSINNIPLETNLPMFKDRFSFT
jgi:phospho-N-acetylmuramoyl-pentapeptide-transferase